MKYTIHTIKNRVLSRLPFEMSEEHYDEILDLYFTFLKTSIESLNSLEIDNPLGTFSVKYGSVVEDKKFFSIPFKEQTPYQQSRSRHNAARFLGNHTNAFNDLSEEEVQEKINECIEKFNKMKQQMENIFKNKKLVFENGKKSKTNTK